MECCSVIIPVYNVEKYIERCLESVVHQEYKNLEIIIIDDGSTDTSGLICDKYQEKDSRITVIHQKNSGQSAARNRALDVIKGKYVAFIDSDDYISPNFISDMIYYMQKNDADIGMCNVKLVYDELADVNDITFGETDSLISVWDKDQAIKKMLTTSYIGEFMCNKVFNSRLFEGIRQPESHIYEDVAIIYKILDKCKSSIIYMDEGRYFYFQRQDSSTHNQFEDKDLFLIHVIEEIIKFSDQNCKKYDLEVRTKLICAAYSLLRRAVRAKRAKTDEARNYLTQALKSNRDIIIKTPYVPGYRKILIFLMTIKWVQPMIVKLYDVMDKEK